MKKFCEEKFREMNRIFIIEENETLVEIKAVEQLILGHKTQAINYLEVSGLAHGLLINFGSTSLAFNRVYNKNQINIKDHPNPFPNNK